MFYAQSAKRNSDWACVVSAPDRHDVVEGAGGLHLVVCRDRTLVPIAETVQWHGSEAERMMLVEEVEALLAVYRGGARLTSHRSGDVYEPMRDLFTILRPQYDR